MDGPIRLDEDWHVSSTFSGGTATVEEVVHAAATRRLSTVCIVDAARRSSGWVGEFVESCRWADRRTRVEVKAGVEVEVLDTNGSLDRPRSAELADYVYVTARRLPTPTGPVRPEEAREQIASGELLPARAIEWLVRAAANATRREDAVVLAHPFGILPELGIDARNVHPAYVRWLAGVLLDRDAGVEVSERWRCPSVGVLGCLLTAGVTVRACTGSDSAETVGRYAWCREIASGFRDMPKRERSGALYVP